MVKVGVHVSIAGSIDRAVDRAVERGCDTFQIFSSNPRGWKTKDLAASDVDRFKEKLEDSGIYPPVDHMPYLPNLASPKDDVYKRSKESLVTELKRCEVLGIPYLVTHPGSHLGEGIENGLQRILECINEAFSSTDSSVMLLLENTAGTKNSMGSRFEDIENIIEGIDQEDRIGICFDTCHAFAAGYELRTDEGLRETLKALDDAVGMKRVKLMHLNDTKGDLNSHLDRHEHIGLGCIGEAGFKNILSHPLFRELPLILETPVDERRGDIENLNKVRELSVK